MIGSHKSRERFTVVNISQFDIIIGRHFLQLHKPTVQWHEDQPNQLVFDLAYCSKHCLPFPIDVYGISKAQQEKEDIAALEQIPHCIPLEAYQKWKDNLQITVTQSFLVKITSKEQKESQSVEEIGPTELHEYLLVFDKK